MILLALSCLSFLDASAQVTFKTIVPQRPILVNESFQVQYVVANADEIADFTVPQLSGFKVVTGPNVYAAKGPDTRKNMVVTLVASHEGKFKLPGATCLVNGKFLKSNDVFITVTSLREPDESLYYLKPGEDPYKKIAQNLFLKITVDKRTSYVGEPIVATFKLYSRLQSQSNIVKNPGFYGFSVYDMVNVNDQIQSEEKLNGHWFDVHTIRKLQLYPLQPGIFTIDPMEISNQVEFSPSKGAGKMQQVVTENMYNRDSTSKSAAGLRTYEMNIKSDPVVINVKSLPGKNRADTFAGAVGKFSLRTFVAKDSILKNEEDSLMIDINGAGNFQRVTAPLINWPNAFEAFEPSVIDTFDKEEVPLRGQRRFKYVFVSNEPGFHTIPSVAFTFFDLDSQTYKTVSSKPFTIFISAKSKRDRGTINTAISNDAKDRSLWILIGAGAFVLVTGLLLWVVNRKKNVKMKREKALANVAMRVVPVDEILQPASLTLNESQKIFYDTLNRCIWNYFSNRLNTQMIKRELSGVLSAKGVGQNHITSILNIIQKCEEGVYTTADIHVDKTELLANTQTTLASVDNTLRQK